ncbi:hypothetical protein EB796_008312 [Bugula neritina]|uniref:Uncharacterized protein n=1 Tax=Bugula neritina TaxID=10212 RepID=A0A7J7K437_BUGNE|nr:hypothetical protein EB796_008312 [Bugula neritina]
MCGVAAISVTAFSLCCFGTLSAMQSEYLMHLTLLDKVYSHGTGVLAGFLTVAAGAAGILSVLKNQQLWIVTHVALTFYSLAGTVFMILFTAYTLFGILFCRTQGYSVHYMNRTSEYSNEQNSPFSVYSTDRQDNSDPPEIYCQGRVFILWMMVEGVLILIAFTQYIIAIWLLVKSFSVIFSCRSF